MSNPFVISMVFKADAAAAKAGLADVSAGIKAVSAEAGKSKASAAAQTAELERLAAAAAKAALTADELAAAEKRRQQASFAALHGPVAQPGAATSATVWRASETAAASLQGAVRGLTASIGDQARATVEAAQGAQVWQSALDDIRARYNPLFAASQRYEQDLRDIAEAERLGAISAREAAAARQQAAMQMAPISAGGRPGGAPGSWITGNLAAQGNDIVMMAMAGQNPLQLALQQGTQVAQVLNGLEKGTSITRTLAAGFMSMVNPVSLVTIGIIAFGALAIQSLGKLVPKVRSAAEAMGDLEQSLGRYRDLTRQMYDGDRLASQFGTAAEAARRLLSELRQLEGFKLEKSGSEALAALGTDMTGGRMRGLRGPSAQFASLEDMFGEAGWLTRGLSLGDMMAGAKSGSPLASAAWAQINEARRLAAEGGSLDDQIAAAEKLRDVLAQAARAPGAETEKVREWLVQITEGTLKLREAKALQENAAGQQAARALTADLVRQAALQETIARYGENSAEARAAELGQLKAATAEKLAALGFDTRSAQFRQAMQAIDDRARARDDAAANQLTRAQEEKLAAIGLERQLLGKTVEERARLVALAEAEKTIRAEQLTGAAALLEIDRARVRAEEQIGLEREQAARQRQLAATTDALDAQIGLARDPLTRASLEAQREYARVLHETNSAKDAGAAADRVRARALAEIVGTNRTQIADLLDEVRVRQDVAAQVANGTLRASEANRVIRQELELRPLLAAAARAEGDEKRRLTEIITGLRIAYEAQAAEDRRQAQNDHLRSGAERLQQARLELALVGQSAELRARVLALVQAERDIRQLGLTGEYAAQARRDAEALGAINRQIERQADAWSTVQGAGEAAIDAVLDKLRGGDIAGAFSGLLDELNKGFFELGVANPLKNLLLGTNLGTLQDVGGLGGIWDRLTGKTRVDEGALIKQASSQVQAMQVAAAQVTISAASLLLGGNAATLLPGLGGAANINAMPSAAAAQVQSILTGVAVGGGARSGAIAGLDRALADPLAAMVTEARRLFGESAVQITSAYRSTERQAQLWQEALQKYGSAAEARKWVAPPGRSNHEFGMAADLQYGSPEVRKWMHQNAASYGLTYRMANEPWHIEPIGGRSAQQGRLEQASVAAQQAMTTFAASAQTSRVQLDQLGAGMGKAGANMGQLSQGMGQFGGALGQILSGVAGSVGGKAGGILSTIIGAVGAMGQGVPLFSRGGFTGAGHPDQAAGIVHAGEYVFDAAATRRIGVANLERMRAGTLRGFRSGGFVGTAPVAAPANAPAAPGDAGGSFVANFDLRGAQDPAAVEEAARRGMRAALAEYRSTGLGNDVRRIVGKPRDR